MSFHVAGCVGFHVTCDCGWSSQSCPLQSSFCCLLLQGLLDCRPGHDCQNSSRKEVEVSLTAGILQLMLDMLCCNCNLKFRPACEDTGSSSRPVYGELKRSENTWFNPGQHISFGKSHFLQNPPQNHQNGVPKTNFPEFPGLGFEGKLEKKALNFLESPSQSQFQSSEVKVLGEIETVIFGYTDTW